MLFLSLARFRYPLTSSGPMAQMDRIRIVTKRYSRGKKGPLLPQQQDFTSPHLSLHNWKTKGYPWFPLPYMWVRERSYRSEQRM